MNTTSMNNDMNTTTNTTTTDYEGIQYEGTFCPEDNKIRLYTGRVSRELYLELKKAGFTPTPKQECDFVATWSLNREDLALSLCGGYLGDESQSPQERSADRAERFMGYQTKRLGEALSGADVLDKIPQALGYQSADKAKSALSGFDRVSSKTLSAWDKAEYWQSRIAGVIATALHKTKTAVRRGRVLEYEKELRGLERTLTESQTKRERIEDVAKMYDRDAERADRMAYILIDSDWHLSRLCRDPENKSEVKNTILSVYEKKPDYTRLYRSMDHLRNLINYENEIIKAQGGNASELDMLPGGMVGSSLILAVNRSPKTKKITSLTVATQKKPYWGNPICVLDGVEYYEVTVNTQRAGENIGYIAPTDETLALLKKVKGAKRETEPEKAPLINPDAESAERLQQVLNKENARWLSRDEIPTVWEMTSAEFAERKKRAMAHRQPECVNLDKEGNRVYRRYAEDSLKIVGRVRIWEKRIVVLTDKKRAAFPFAVVDEAAHA